MECNCKRCTLDRFNRHMAQHGAAAYLPKDVYICGECHQMCDRALDHRVECPFKKIQGPAMPVPYDYDVKRKFRR